MKEGLIAGFERLFGGKRPKMDPWMGGLDGEREGDREGEGGREG